MADFVGLIFVAAISYGVIFLQYVFEKKKVLEKDLSLISRLKDGHNTMCQIAYNSEGCSSIEVFNQRLKQICKEKDIILQYYSDNDWAILPFESKTNPKHDDLSRRYYRISRTQIEQAKKDVEGIKNNILNKLFDKIKNSR